MFMSILGEIKTENPPEVKAATQSQDENQYEKHEATTKSNDWEAKTES